jgi:kinesin family protein 20
MTCNYIEIYNEEIFDLLSETKNKKEKKKLIIKERDKVFYLASIYYINIDLTDRHIASAEELIEALNEGVSKKIHATTGLNNHSSRSHTIFKVNLHYDEDEIVTLSIVDLAGCERNTRTETNGKELQQACKINLSLSVLNKCFEALRYNSMYMNKKFVPFRESKLTMLFQEYFLGSQNITLIANITSLKEDFDETIRVLSYTSSMREIKPIRSVIPLPR